MYSFSQVDALVLTQKNVFLDVMLVSEMIFVSHVLSLHFPSSSRLIYLYFVISFSRSLSNSSLLLPHKPNFLASCLAQKFAVCLSEHARDAKTAGDKVEDLYFEMMMGRLRQVFIQVKTSSHPFILRNLFFLLSTNLKVLEKETYLV